MEDGIEIATVYAFSTENWNRDPSEVNTLMSIFAKYAESLTSEASSRNVKVRILSTGESQHGLCGLLTSESKIHMTYISYP